MRKSKGFTLIELVGVIVVVSLLVLLITPVISSVLKESKEKLYDRTLENIKLAAKNWTSDEKNKEQIPTEEGNCLVITLKQLKDEGYIDLDIKDPRDGSLIDDEDTLVILTRHDEMLEYELVLDGLYDTDSCYTEKVDPTAPVISANKFNDIRKNFDLKISCSDDYGLSASNVYQYYLSSSNNELKGGTWKTYQNGVTQNIGQNLDGEYYLFVKRVSNIEGKLSSLGGILVNTNNDKYHRFGSYKFDNTKPVWNLYEKTNTNDFADTNFQKAIYAYDDDVITLKIRGTDLNFKNDILDIDNINIYIGGSLVDKDNINISLSARKDIANGVEYIITLADLTQKGSLAIEIASGTLIDQAGNVSDKSIINTGFKINECIYIKENPTDPYYKSWAFGYTGGPQTFKAMCSGVYRITLRGAQGGNGGGQGAIVTGEITIYRKEEYKIYVGGKGNVGKNKSDNYGAGYNGGGGGMGSYGGGGATDMRIGEGISYDDRIMVAGGGGAQDGKAGGAGGGASTNGKLANVGKGGSGAIAGGVTCGSCSKPWQNVSAQNGYTCGAYTKYDPVKYPDGYSAANPKGCTIQVAGGGSQTAGGTYGATVHFQDWVGYWAGNTGKKGVGGTGRTSGGGGGGYWGGGGGSPTPFNRMSGGGGSSYISGYTGCVDHSSGIKFTNAKMSGEDSIGYNSGNGSATIELIEAF